MRGSVEDAHDMVVPYFVVERPWCGNWSGHIVVVGVVVVESVRGNGGRKKMSRAVD